MPEVKGKVDGHPKLPKGGKLVYLKPHGVDKVPALLQENEIVIPVKHAKKVAKFLKEENIKLPNMKKGGRVKKRAKRTRPTQQQTQRQTVIIQQVAPRRRRAPRKPKASIDNTVRVPNLLQFGQPVGGMPRLREDQPVAQEKTPGPVVQAKTPSVAAPQRAPLVRSGPIVSMDLAPVKVDETSDDLEQLIQNWRLPSLERAPLKRVVSGPAFPIVQPPEPIVEASPGQSATPSVATTVPAEPAAAKGKMTTEAKAEFALGMGKANVRKEWLRSRAPVDWASIKEATGKKDKWDLIRLTEDRLRVLDLSKDKFKEAGMKSEWKILRRAEAELLATQGSKKRKKKAESEDEWDEQTDD